ncbi:hypothetical protein BH09PLA1_BH09PLA1_17740 [soil metagenome]
MRRLLLQKRPMTLAASNPNATISYQSQPTLRAVDPEARRRDRKTWCITVAIVGLMFLALENPYWIPGGDSEVYIASARSIALGQGYMFNGQAARIAPPGWPMVLAFVMKFVSPTFLALKLVTLTCMLAGLATFYWVLRRFASPPLCASIIVLTALISHVYALTYWLHSDALFTLVTALTLLLALQISEGDRSVWKVVAILLLCVTGSAVRYAGIINISIIVAALLHGRIRPQLDHVWITAVLAGAVTFGSFFGVRFLVNYFAPRTVAFESSAQIDPTAVLNDLQIAEGGDTKQPDVLTGTSGRSGYGQRILGYGTWLSYLLWQPFRLGTGSHLIWYLATFCGWIVALISSVAVIEATRRRQWLLPATALYTFALCLNWPHATARYLVPITPLLLLLILQGLLLLQARATQTGLRTTWRVVAVTGLGSVVLCNLVLYAEEVRIMRSSHLADRYEAGLNKSLVAAAVYLSEHQVGNWQTAVNPEYRNLNKRRMSPTGLRIITMLTGKAALQIPKKWTEAPYKVPNDRDFRKLFIAKHKISYYLEQPTISPWRVSHYRMGWLQEWMTGNPALEIEAGWKLYRCDGASSPVQIPLPQDVEFPKRVPGI